MNRHLLLIGLSLGCLAACPSRDNTYVAGTVISPAEVMRNEDALFNGIQNGLATDCIADNAITTSKIAVGGVTSSDILDGTITTTDLAFALNPGNTLPAGAVFFMFTGSCPSWTTDVSATYSARFIQINATPLTTGGNTTHTHGVGSYVSGSAHTHTVPRDGWGATDVGISGRMATAENASAGNALATATGDNTTGSGGGSVAVTGTSASTDHTPQFVTARLCQVN